MNRSLNVANCWKICHLRFICCRFAGPTRVSLPHRPSGRSRHGKPRRKGSHGLPRWRHRWATAGGTAESRTTSGRAAASEDGEGTCRTRATGQQRFKTSLFLDNFLGITVVEVNENGMLNDFEMSECILFYHVLQLLYKYIYIYSMMHLELMRIHSVDMAFIYGLPF